MKKYLLHIIYDVDGWAYYHRSVALQKYAPSDFEVTIGQTCAHQLKSKPYDIVLQLCFSSVKPLRELCDREGYKCLIVSSYNVGWGYANKWLTGTLRPSHAVIINNYEMWDKSGRLPNTYHISNGVDREIFKPHGDIDKRKFKALWCGSRFHQQVKGYHDILLPLQRNLRRRGIELELRLTNSGGKDRLTLNQMANWYNSGSVYVIASKTEGTPNPGIESASCGLPVISTHCGNMPELIKNGHNGFICNRDPKSLENSIIMTQSKLKEMSHNMIHEIEPWDWKIRSQEYYSLFRKLLNK